MPKLSEIYEGEDDDEKITEKQKKIGGR